MTDAILEEMQAAAVRTGRVEWGATRALDADGHADQTKNSVEITAQYFDQNGPHKMHGLYLQGTETVLCHTGTSPNSPVHARIMAALWNNFVDNAEATQNEGQGDE